MKKILRKVIIISLIALLTIFNINFPSYGEETLITDLELNEYLKNRMGENFQINSGSGKFEIIDNENNKSYNLYYNLETYEFYTEETFNKNDKAEVVEQKMKMLLEIPDYCFKAVADAKGVEQDIYDSYVKEFGLCSLYSDWHFIYLAMDANAKQKGEVLYVKDILNDESILGHKEYECCSISIELVDKNDTTTIKLKIKANSSLDFSAMNPEIDKYDYCFILKVGETLTVPWFSGFWDTTGGYDESIVISFENNNMIINGSEIIMDEFLIRNWDTADFSNGVNFPDSYSALVRVVSNDYDGVTGIIKQVDNSNEDNNDNEKGENEAKDENNIKDEKDENDVKQEDNNKQKSPDNTLSQNKLPATGKSFLAICSLIILTIICMVKYYKYKKID